MRFGACPLLVIVVSVMSVGCSMTVPAEKAYGTYVASYPFGTEKLTLNHDGTFVQEVTIEKQTQATARGSWTFDADKSRVELNGELVLSMASAR